MNNKITDSATLNLAQKIADTKHVTLDEALNILREALNELRKENLK